MSRGFDSPYPLQKERLLMGTLWIMILVILLPDGNAKVELQWPLQKQFNTEASCNENGEKAALSRQMQLGLDNAKVLWQCQSVNMDDLGKVLSKPGTNI